MTTPRAVALAAALVGALVAPAAALGATITVTTQADSTDGDGLCSLREAVLRANTNVSIDGECNPAPAGADTIVLGPGTFKLTRSGRGENLGATGDLDLIGPVTIQGAGASLTTIDAAGIDRVFEARASADVEIRGVTITGGLADAGGTDPTATTPAGLVGGSGGAGSCGGGILAFRAALKVSASRVTGNAAGAGGPGLSVTAPAGAKAFGGTGGPGGGGGGICVQGGALTLTGVTVTANRSGAGGLGGSAVGGGGIAAAGGVGAGGDAGYGLGGAGGAGGDGGGVAVNRSDAVVGSLVVSDSTITGNATSAGGRGGSGTGVAGGGGTPPGAPSTGYGSVGGQGGRGGGIGGNGALTVVRSLVAANTTGGGGQGGKGIAGDGAAYGANGGAGGDGGGVGTVASNARTLVNVTLTGNLTGPGGGSGGHAGGLTATSGDGGRGGMGGGIASEGDLLVEHATISGNGAGSAGTTRAEGGLSGLPGTPGSGSSAGVWAPGQSSLARSIFAGNACDTTSFPLDDLLNVAFSASGCTGRALDPLLGPLADNGGPTRTLRLGAGSPAIDRVPAAVGCQATDQRGAVRPNGAGCDAGAYEVAPPTATTGSASAITGSSATIAGTIGTRGLDTDFRIEFGSTTSYGRQVVGSAAGAATPSAVTAALTGLTPLTAYHYRLVAIGPDGTATGADRTLTTTAAAAIAGGAGAPRLRGLGISPRSFAVAPRTGGLRDATGTRPALGARIRFRLSEIASVRLVIRRIVPGRRTALAKGRTRCVVAPPGARVVRAKRCALHRPAGTLRRAGATGQNVIPFRGRVGRRRLTVGTYQLIVTAIDASGARSLPARTTFTVVSRA